MGRMAGVVSDTYVHWAWGPPLRLCLASPSLDVLFYQDRAGAGAVTAT